jgi:hypothetical protein
MFQGWNDEMFKQVSERLSKIPVWKLILYVLFVSLVLAFLAASDMNFSPGAERPQIGR